MDTNPMIWYNMLCIPSHMPNLIFKKSDKAQTMDRHYSKLFDVGLNKHARILPGNYIETVSYTRFNSNNLAPQSFHPNPELSGHYTCGFY